jgi:hypothetical protein
MGRPSTSDPIPAVAREEAYDEARAETAHDAGGVRFATSLERDRAIERLVEGGWLVVVVEIEPSVRGRVFEAVHGAIEREIGEWRARAGSAPSARASSLDRSGFVEQIHRATRAGACGIAVVIDPLRAAAGSHNALEPRDGSALRVLADVAGAYPFGLWLDERDAATLAFADPVPLARLLDEVPAKREVARDPPADRRLVTPSAPSAAAATVPEELWRGWTHELAGARGPQPLSALEKLFTDSYVPLSNAIAGGLDDPRARAAHDEFRQTFARGYAEAFPTFAVTTKRPRMVLDAHEVAGRIARLHGARSTRLLLVDGMRWDLSRLIEQQLGARLGSRAAITDEIVLFSALPTTTMRQLETIARGVDALRAPAELDPDADLPRGRTAEYIRRLRIGPRELYKLDLVEARLSGSRGTALRSFPAIAEATADAIARHAETLAPHTLLFVFGDHGFTIDRTGTAAQGGASPEEVLVGAFSLLLGDVH